MRHNPIVIGSLTCTLLASSGVFAQYPNIRVSSPSASAPEEVTIAINPVNPNVLAAGSNLRYFFQSTDGGYTWNESLLPTGTWGDPCVMFDAKGTLYYGHLANISTKIDPTAHWIDRMLIHRSTDAGVTWKDSATVNKRGGLFAQDKEWLAADMTGSPFHGNLYMAWTEFDNYGSTLATDSSRILFSRSTDGGTTWSAALRISDHGGNCTDSDSTVEGAVPAVGPNGEVYVAWAGPLGIIFDKSTDGGVTWGVNRFVADQPGGWDYSIAGIYRANGLPITACDVSNGPHRGTIYVSWTDQRHGLDNTDVFICRSTDGGATWGGVTQVNSDMTVRDQFFNWMTVDQANGDVYEVYYDRRETTGEMTDVYVARSVDGGATFNETKVSSSSFFPTPGIFFGDYTNIAAYGGKVYPIWMRLDTLKLSVWIAKMDMSALGVEEQHPDIPLTCMLDQNYPNPFNPSTNIGYTVGGFGHQASDVSVVKLSVYDILGREVAVLVNEPKGPGTYNVRFDGSRLASGVYVYRLISGSFVSERRMVLVR